MSQFCRDLAKQIILSPNFVETMTDIMSVEIERQLRGIAAGDSIYVPKTISRDDIGARNNLIRSQFNGHNHEELSSRFNVTVRHIRRILKTLPGKSYLARLDADQSAAVLGEQSSISLRRVQQLNRLK